jgi:UDP-4-amino-4,6-dideoxy-N-acetyl-beta-L-altrosamine N-acetyltransferase
MLKLRLMSASDMGLVLEWRNRLEVRSKMYTSHIIGPEEHRRWFDAAIVDQSKRLLMCIDIDQNPVGVVIFSNIDPEHRTATWAFYSGDTQRRGVGSEMEVLALDYAFGDLGLEKLNCEVLSSNMSVVEFHRKYGFRIEGVFRSHFFRDGVRHDVYRLGNFRKTWMEYVRPMIQRMRETGSRPSLKAGMLHRQRVLITRDLIQRFADVSGDTNPVHIDDAAARAAGFDGVIAHGMLIGAGLSRIIGTEFPGPGTAYISQSLHFARPAYPDAELDYELRVASVIGRRVILGTTVADAGGQTVMSGEAEVLLPKEESVEIDLQDRRA